VTANDGDERDEDGEDERHGRDGDRHGVPSSRSICSSSCYGSSVHCRNISSRATLSQPRRSPPLPSPTYTRTWSTADHAPRTAAILPRRTTVHPFACKYSWTYTALVIFKIHCKVVQKRFIIWYRSLIGLYFLSLE